MVDLKKTTSLTPKISHFSCLGISEVQKLPKFFLVGQKRSPRPSSWWALGSGEGSFMPEAIRFSISSWHLCGLVSDFQGLATPWAGLIQESSCLSMPLLHSGIFEHTAPITELQSQPSLGFQFGLEASSENLPTRSVLVFHFSLSSEPFTR